METPPTDPQRWQRIEALFQQANSLLPQTRAEFLAQACGGDEELRREVETLLAVSPDAEDYFARYANRASLSPSSEDTPDNADEAIVIGRRQPAETPYFKSRFFRWALAGLVAVTLLYLLMGWLSLKYCCTGRAPAFRWENRDSSLYVTFVEPQFPVAQQLQVGDQILAINGDRNHIQTEWYVAARRVRAGEPMRFLVRRDGEEQLLEISSARFPYIRSGRLQYNLLGYPRALIFLGVTLLILLLRREDRFSRAGYLAFLSLAVMNLRQVLIPIQTDLTGSEEWLEAIVLLLNGGNVFIPLGVAFCLLFPPGAILPRSRFWSGLKYLLFTLTALLALNKLLVVLTYHSPPLADWLFARNYAAWFRFFYDADALYFVFGVSCICAVLIRNYIVVKETALQRRIKLVIYGSLATIAPAVIYTLTEQFVHWLRLDGETWGSVSQWLRGVMNICALTLPLTWGYAILTRRVYDVRVVVRRSLRYLLARNLLSLLLLLPALALVYRIVSQPDQTVRQVLFAQPLTLVLSALAALSLIYRRQLRTWLDRRFFREQYDQEQILHNLIDEIRGFDDLPALCQRVEQALEETLHPLRVRFFLRQPPGRDLRLVQPAEANVPDGLLPETSALYQLLKHSTAPLDFPLPRRSSLPPREERRLAGWQASLLLPLHDSREQLVGLMMLGERRSDEPYSSADRRLLAALARQMATVYEVAQLRGQVTKKTQAEFTVLRRLAADEVNLLRECPQCGACYDVGVNDCAACDVALALTLPIERTIEARYRLERRIGQGGMGTVYRATDLSLRRAVAVKVIKADCFGDAKLLRRFEREAQAAARLDHQHIVKVFDYGRTPAGGAWLVMEFIQGLTLRDELNRAGKLSPQFAAELFGQLFDGVAAAHQRGVIHRDLKPENVLLVQSGNGIGQLKILDFGLAKMRRADQEFSANSTQTITQPGLLIGTPGYMAPEQLSGKDADERSDIFAIGVMLVEAITGARPFHGQTPGELLQSILNPSFCLSEEIVKLPQLHLALRRCLASDVEARHTTITEAKADVISALNQLPA